MHSANFCTRFPPFLNWSHYTKSGLNEGNYFPQPWCAVTLRGPRKGWGAVVVVAAVVVVGSLKWVKDPFYCIFKSFVLQLPTRDLQLLCVFCFETLAFKTVLSAFWFSLSHPLACRRNKRRSATRGKNIQYGKLFPNSHNNHNYCTALPESANIEIFKVYTITSREIFRDTMQW